MSMLSKAEKWRTYLMGVGIGLILVGAIYWARSKAPPRTGSPGGGQSTPATPGSPAR